LEQTLRPVTNILAAMGDFVVLNRTTCAQRNIQGILAAMSSFTFVVTPYYH
jgi:hypothetical protein